MTTPVALARILRDIVAETAQLLITDGMEATVPRVIKITNSDTHEETFDAIRRTVTPVYNHLIDMYKTTGYALHPTPELEFPRLVVLRVLRLLAQSPLIEASQFHIRPIGAVDLGAIKAGSDSKEYSGSSAILQFKNEITPKGITFTWALLVNGKMISRGEAQPIGKLVSSLLRPIDMPEVNDQPVQAGIAALAMMKQEDTPYYVYLTNQKIAKHYQMFQEFQSTTSCMSKAAASYHQTGTNQHPMDGYDASPDWRLLFLSLKSPEEILVMAEAAIASPDIADSIMKYPFMTRCMVLPTHKQKSHSGITVPYVFGKIYGNDKLVKYFFKSNDATAPYAHNNNLLMAHAYYIAGGRISVQMSTKDGYGAHRILPYFDQANQATLITDEDGKEWWESTYADYENSLPFEKRAKSLWKCGYNEGTGFHQAYLSPHYKGYKSYETHVPVLFPTLVGAERQEVIANYYQNYVLNGTTLLVPNRMVHGGIMPHELGKMLDGTLQPIADLLADPVRYINLDTAGYCDITNPVHTVLRAALGL